MDVFMSVLENNMFSPQDCAKKNVGNREHKYEKMLHWMALKWRLLYGC